MFAYGLIAAIVMVGSVAGFVWSRKRKARKLRLRGIKSYSTTNQRSTAR